MLVEIESKEESEPFLFPFDWEPLVPGPPSEPESSQMENWRILQFSWKEYLSFVVFQNSENLKPIIIDIDIIGRIGYTFIV